MYEQETQRTAHLTILLCNTVFIIALIGEAIFFEWEAGAVILLFLGVVAGWLLHITAKIPESIRLWLYVVLMMLTFFFYGSHEDSIYELAPVMAVIILIYTSTEAYYVVRVCAFSYYLTMCYDFVFLLGNPLDLPTHTMARIILHFVLIFIAERLAETMIRRRRDERKKTDERISRLEETNRRAEDFLANVSHELRTPINAVMGITAVMLKDETDPEKKKDMLSIHMAGNRLFGQIEDILDYTEIDTGRVIVSEENYMVSSLVNDIIVESRMKNMQDVELIFDVDAGIPLTLLGDGKKIKKIMKHLIDNAVKFTKKGGVYVRIYALDKSYGINLCIQVSDTGVGIAEEEMGKIKEKFFQSSGGRNRKASGLGLGLSIVYGMVTAMDGFIRLESEEGKGTVISVSIPQKVVDATPGMEVPNRGDLCIALYLKPEKYEIPQVRDYYNATVTHMVQELDLVVHRVFDLEELKKLAAMYQLTHLVIGKEEYEEDTSYYEGLGKEMDIILVAAEDSQLSVGNRVKLVTKPFYSLPIVNVLNSQAPFESVLHEQVNMVCPGVRMLVVDDEPMNLMVAEGIFNAYQMEVKTASSGMEAIELCKKETFDLIFLDHMMPEMDGVETLKILRQNQADTGRQQTVIAFTANAVSGAREMFLQEGFDEFISKPIEDQELKRLLRKVLPKSSIAYVSVKEPKNAMKQKEGEPASLGQSKAEKTAAKQDGIQEPVLEDDTKPGKLELLNEGGFHTEAGLQFCRGDSVFYETVLMQFAKDAERKMTDIETFFRAEDVKNYQIMVHALKSSSKMVGANTLSEMAKAAEEAAKKQDLTYIRENHGELLSKYREMTQCIFKVLCPERQVLSEEAPAAGTEVSREELLARLSELKDCLGTFEAEKAESLLADMRGLVYQETLVSELLRDVGEDVEEFELGAAVKKVKTFIGSLEGGET